MKTCQYEITCIFNNFVLKCSSILEVHSSVTKGVREKCFVFWLESLLQLYTGQSNLYAGEQERMSNGRSLLLDVGEMVGRPAFILHDTLSAVCYQPSVCHHHLHGVTRCPRQFSPAQRNTSKTSHSIIVNLISSAFCLDLREE